MTVDAASLPDTHDQLIDAVCRAVPPLVGARLAILPLPGGLTNRNYRVTVDGIDRFVARFAGAGTELLAIDRDAEHRNSLSAARAGIAPQVSGYSKPDQLLVVEWIEGRTFEEADLDDSRVLDRLAAACRQLHGAQRFGNDFDMFGIQRGYLEIVEARGFRLPIDYREFEPQVRRVEAALGATAAGTVPCHNDLLAANVMESDGRLWLIDFEYAGNNDACFELGNIWSESSLEPDRLEHLVTSYFGAPSPGRTARARLFALMSKYGWTLWASIQDAVSSVDFDFWQWGMEKYERAVAEFRGSQFDSWIDEIEDYLRHEGAEPWPK